METIQFINLWLESFGVGVFFYLLFSILAFFIFWKFGFKTWQHKKIQEKHRANSPQIKREIAYSLRTLAIFSTIDLLIFYLEGKGYTLAYTEISKYGISYFFLSILLMMILHDTYFYFTHRLLHWKPLYIRFHKLHHESIDTTPFTGNSFHFGEVLVEYGITIIIAFLIPAHPLAYITYQIISSFDNAIAHMGYEIYPKGWTKFPLLRWKTTSTHHNMHHSKFNGNYGLYFTFWDKLLRTEFPNYESKFEEIASRRPLEDRSPTTMIYSGN